MTWTCRTCHATIRGRKSEHCACCHETFTGTRPGDMHRVGKHGVTYGPELGHSAPSESVVLAALRPDVAASLDIGPLDEQEQQ